MGRTFTCAYLKPKDDTGSTLQARLKAKLLREGFEPSEEPAERWLALLTTEGSPWCFLLDSDTALDAPNAPELRKAARKMAKATDCDVVSAEVLDSDAMAMVFCGGGAEDIVVCGLADGYGNLGCGPRTGKGKPALWQEFFGLTPEQTNSLSALWRKHYDFAEAQLDDILTLLGLDAAGTDLYPEEPEESELPEGRTLEVLHFCAKQKPFEIITEGETVIDVNTRSIYLEPGNAACDCFLNIGGITTGAAFLLVGEFLKDFRGTFSEVSIEKRTEYKDTHSWNASDKQTAQLEPITLPEGQAAMIARFPAFVFPEGVKINKEAVTNWRAAQDAQWVRQVIVRYTMLSCPHEVPAGTMITSMLVPKHGRALQAIPLQLRPQGAAERESQARRQQTTEMMRASMLEELSKSKNSNSKKHRMTQELFNLLEANGWDIGNESVNAEAQRIHEAYMGDDE